MAWQMENILQIVDVRDRWLGSQDVTFPPRKILPKTITEDSYGRMVSSGVGPDI